MRLTAQLAILIKLYHEKPNKIRLPTLQVLDLEPVYGPIFYSLLMLSLPLGLHLFALWVYIFISLHFSIFCSFCCCQFHWMYSWKLNIFKYFLIRKWKFGDGKKIVSEIIADSDSTTLKTWKKVVFRKVSVCCLLYTSRCV